MPRPLLPEALTGTESVFLLFQTMFAATAATIVSGAVAERMRFGPSVIASVVITAGCEALGPVAADRLFSRAVKQAETLPEARAFAPQRLL